MGMLKVTNRSHHCKLPNRKWTKVDSKEEADYSVPFLFESDGEEAHYKIDVVYNTCRTEPPYPIGSVYECDECGATYKVKTRPHGRNFIALGTYWHELGRIEAFFARRKK